MSMQQILESVRAFDGVVELAPVAGSEFPEIAWGDHFFYHSPDGTIPPNTQPFATIVTKDYPDDHRSNLDPDGRWRLNIHVGSEAFARLIGVTPREFGAGAGAGAEAGAEAEAEPATAAGSPRDFAAADVILPHPVYGALGWIAIVDPGSRTTDAALELLRDAHASERRRTDRHRPEGPS